MSWMIRLKWYNIWFRKFLMINRSNEVMSNIFDLNIKKIIWSLNKTITLNSPSGVILGGDGYLFIVYY
jgi:hypothetical protein